jgi:lysophospholipase L1-like esterase
MISKIRFLASLVCALTAWSIRAQTPAAPTTPPPAPDLARNPAPVVTPLNPALPTIFVAGDSTAARGKGVTQQGWAVPFADYFDPAKANVANRARGGRSSRTFIAEGSWDKILADLKAGDIVLIQFSHNDGSPVNESESVPVAARRSRGTIPGLGEETQEIDNIITKQHEVVHTYGWYFRKMIADVKATGAQPVVVSSTVRNNWKDGHIERGPGKYREWAYDVAKQTAVPFVDLTTTMADKFDALGAEKTKAVYQQDSTHFDAVGADMHAAGVVAGLKGLRLKAFDELLSTKGVAVEADKLAWLRLPVPRNRALPSLFLVGDSTVRNGRGDGQEKGGQWGWGDYLAPYFDTEKINVVNRAVGGTGVQTFMATHWGNTLKLMKAGDVVAIQFGHNDNPPRGPLPGIGDETGERENPRTKEKQTLHTWGWYLRRYIADIRAKGATPIVCSLIPRKTWDKDGKIARNHDTFAGWAQQVAVSEKVAFIDLNELIAARYDALGHEAVMKLFPDVTPDEHTHTNQAGAEFNAGVVVTALKSLSENPVSPFLK